MRRADTTLIRAVFRVDGPRLAPGACRLAAEAVALGGVDDTVAASSRHLAGLLALGVGRLDEAAAHFAAGTAALGGVEPAAQPFFSAMTICWVTDHRGLVPIPIAEESMVLGRRVGAEQARGYLEAATAVVERLGGNDDAALELLDQAVRRFDALGDVYGLAYATGQRAHTLRWKGDLEGAIRCFEQVERFRSSLRDVRAVAMTVAGRVVADAMLGRGEFARRRVGEVVDWMRRTGDVPGIALTLHTAALVEALLGDDAAALPLLAESIRVGEDTLPIHALGWQLLLHAQLLTNVGDADGAGAVTALAAARFQSLGDTLGLAAVQRPCKAAQITIPGG